MKDVGTIYTTSDFNRGRVLKPKVGGDDRQNSFQRVNVARDAALKADKEIEVKPESVEERIARKEANKRIWSGNDRIQTTPLSRPVDVTNLPEDVTEAQAREMPLSELARVVERGRTSPTTTAASAAIQSRVQLDKRTFTAVILQWQAAHTNYYDSPWNGEQFNACLVDHVLRGELMSYDLLDAVFAELLAGNHLEPKPAPRSRGDFATRSGPTPYQRRHLAPEEQAVIDERRRQAVQNEEATVKAMPLSELQKRMRAGFKDSRPIDTRGAR